MLSWMSSCISMQASVVGAESIIKKHCTAWNDHECCEVPKHKTLNERRLNFY